jgi:hypothetical protein
MTGFTCESWDTHIERERVVALPCEVSWELEDSGCVCAWPLCGSGAKGEEEYP